MNWQEKISRRQESNFEIIDILQKEASENPNLRFTQLLWSLGIFRRSLNGIEDTFYEESVDTLEKLKQR